MKVSNEPLYQINIIRRLSLKYNLPYDIVHKIVYSQFKLVSKIMKEGNFSKILLNGFCTFQVDPKRLKRLNKDDTI